VTQLQGAERGAGSRPATLTIRVSTGSGVGSTALSAFDAALRATGVHNFNLVRLSSVIPPCAVVLDVDGGDQVRGGWGDRLYCVYGEQRATTPGTQAWAGIGWVFQADREQGGLFVEHEGHSRKEVTRSISDSLADLTAGRPEQFGPVQMRLASATCVDRPVCALVVASYETAAWSRTSVDVR
jgi:arginine decarboxylase